MTWLRLDDSIASHTKVLRAGPEAAWLWVCCIAYSTRHLTDGFVPSEALVTLGNFRNLSSALSKAREVRLLEDRDGGVCVHHYLEHNPSAEQVRARLVELAELARRGGKASAAKRSGQPARSSAPVEPARSSAPLNVDPLPSSPLRSSPGEAPARAREEMIGDEGRAGLPGIIAREWVQVLKEHGVSAVPDLAGAGICEEHLRHLTPEQRMIVLRGYRDDPDPWLDERGHALRFLTADRANRYLMPRVRKPPPPTLTSWGPCDIGTPPERAHG